MLDWFYGINLSRALMASIRSAGANQVMSIGRVQGPSLAILAKKEKDINAFVSSPYWEVSCEARGVRFEHSRGRFLKKEEAALALQSSSSPGEIKSVEKKEYAQPPQPPFDLTSLQVEAYRAFGFSPAFTLEIAQTLYESSLISYPRTSSQKLPAKLGLKRIIESLGKQSEYAASAQSLLAEGRVVPLEGKKDDPAHPAIHPTGQSGGMGEKERKLYDLITKRFLSCFSQSAKREAQKVRLVCGGQEYAATGNRTVFPGWFDIYAPYVKLEETTLPPFSQGEKVDAGKFGMEEKKTMPPKRYTQASIISELEKLGLGTKATRATILETLYKRGYLDGKSIEVTPFGMAVYDILSSAAPEIMDEELTRGIEDEMEKIKDGENEKKAVEDGKGVLRRILAKFDGKEREIGLSLLSGLKRKEMGDSLLGKCVKCGQGELRAIRSKLGKQFVGCSNYPACTATYPLPGEAKIVPLGRACKTCGTPEIRVVRKARKPFEMCINPQCDTKRGWARPQPAAQAASSAARAPAKNSAIQEIPAAAKPGLDEAKKVASLKVEPKKAAGKASSAIKKAAGKKPPAKKKGTGK
jgi:DNA topoisomerase-1